MGQPQDAPFLFAMLAVQMGHATAVDVAAVLDGAEVGSDVEVLLLAASVLTAAQATAVRAQIQEISAAQVAAVTLGNDPLANTLAPSFGWTPKDDDRADLKPAASDQAGADRITLEQPGRYQFHDPATGVTELGRGGIGRVLSAVDQHIGRQVAVKELLAGTPGSVGFSIPLEDRFLHEARVTGQLEHPSIVPVYELGRRADGRLYYTMRIVRGETLAKAMRSADGPSGRLGLLGHFLDLCQAIAFAHSRHVVHRDIKPENVMIGAFGETVVLDWGLAKSLSEPDDNADFMHSAPITGVGSSGGRTVDGSIVGTPSYMSPEQAAGQIDEIDERSDVWGLGAVLYQLLTGRPPFVGTDPMEIARQVREDDVTPILARCPEAPSELAAVAEKALRRDKAQRYVSAESMAKEVDAYLHGRRVSAYEYGSMELARRFVNRNKALTTFALIAVLTLFIGSVLVFDAWRVSDADRALAIKVSAAAQISERSAHANLSQALLGKAERALKDGDAGHAAIYAASAMVHSPATPLGPWAEAKSSTQRAAALARTREALNSTWAEALRQRRITWERSISADVRLFEMKVSPDGLHALARGSDGYVLVWAVDTGAQLLRLRTNPLASANRAVFLGTERVAVVDPVGRAVRIFRIADGVEETRTPAAQEEIVGVASSANGSTIAIATATSVSVLDVPTMNVRWVRQTVVDQMRISPDGRWLYFERDWRAQVADTQTGSLHEVSDARGVAFTSDSKRILMTQGHRRHVVELTLETGAKREVFHGSAAGGRIAVDADARYVVVGTGLGWVVWDLSTGRRITAMLEGVNGVQSLAITPDGRRVLSLQSYTSGLMVWRFAPGDARDVVELTGGKPTAVGLGPEGRYLALGASDGHVEIFDTTSGRRVATRETHLKAIHRLAVLSRSRVVVRDLAGTQTIVDMNGTGSVVIDRSSAPISIWIPPVVMPDRRAFLSVDGSGSAQLRSAADGRILRTLSTPSTRIGATAVSPDGTRLLTGGRSGRIQLWDRQSGAAIRSWDEPRAVTRLAFSPDGHRVAVGTRAGLDFRPTDGSSSRVVAPVLRNLMVAALNLQWIGETRFVGVRIAGPRIVIVDSTTGEHVETLRVDSASLFATTPQGEIWFTTPRGARRKRLGEQPWHDEPQALLASAETALGSRLNGSRLWSPSFRLLRTTRRPVTSTSPVEAPADALAGRVLSVPLSFPIKGVVELLDPSTGQPLSPPVRSTIEAGGRFVLPAHAEAQSYLIQIDADHGGVNILHSPRFRPGVHDLRLEFIDASWLDRRAVADAVVVKTDAVHVVGSVQHGRFETRNDVRNITCAQVIVEGATVTAGADEFWALNVDAGTSIRVQATVGASKATLELPPMPPNVVVQLTVPFLEADYPSVPGCE